MRQRLGLSKLGYVRNNDRVDVNNSDNELVNESSDGTRRFRLDPPKRSTELYPDSWMRNEGIDRGYMVNYLREETDEAEAPPQLRMPQPAATKAGLTRGPTRTSLPFVRQVPSIPQVIAPLENSPPKHEPAMQLAGSTPAAAWYRKNTENHGLTASAAAQGASLWKPAQATQSKAADANNSAQIPPRLWNPRQFIANIRDTRSFLVGRNTSSIAPTGVSNLVQETSSISQGSCAMITESECSVQPPPAASSVRNTSSPSAPARQRALTKVCEQDRAPFIGRVEVQVQGFPGDIPKTLGLGKYQQISCDEKELQQICLKIIMEDPAVSFGESVLAAGWLEGAAAESSVENTLMSSTQKDVIPTDTIGRQMAYTEHCCERVQQVEDLESLLKQFSVVGEETVTTGDDRGELWTGCIDNSTPKQQDWVQSLKTEGESQGGEPRSRCTKIPALGINVEAKDKQEVDRKGPENIEKVPPENGGLHFDVGRIEGMGEKCSPGEEICMGIMRGMKTRK